MDRHEEEERRGEERRRGEGASLGIPQWGRTRLSFGEVKERCRPFPPAGPSCPPSRSCTVQRWCPGCPGGQMSDQLPAGASGPLTGGARPVLVATSRSHSGRIADRKNRTRTRTRTTSPLPPSPSRTSPVATCTPPPATCNGNLATAAVRLSEARRPHQARPPANLSLARKSNATPWTTQDTTSLKS